MSVLAERLHAVHDALGRANIPHAFGGAIALAYCIAEPRGTRDLDVNVFVGAERAAEVIASLPAGVRRPEALVVFKALFNRTKDWADIEAILAAGAVRRDDALEHVRRLVGTADPSAIRLAALAGRGMG